MEDWTFEDLGFRDHRDFPHPELITCDLDDDDAMLQTTIIKPPQ